MPRNEKRAGAGRVSPLCARVRNTPLLNILAGNCLPPPDDEAMNLFRRREDVDVDDAETDADAEEEEDVPPSSR